MSVLPWVPVRRPFSFDLAANTSIVSAIEAHQNPERCSENGLGSSLHVLTAMLGYAMQVGRVLVVSQDLAPCAANAMHFQASNSTRWPWADETLCPPSSPPFGLGLVCLLGSSSNCTADVNARRHEIQMLSRYDRPTLDHAGPLVSSRVVCDGRGVCPHQFARPGWLAPPSKAEEAAQNYAGWWVASPPLCRKLVAPEVAQRTRRTMRWRGPPRVDVAAAGSSVLAFQLNGSLPPFTFRKLERPPSKKGKWRATWWRGQAIEHLLRPSKATRAYLQAQYASFWAAHRQQGEPPRPEQLVAVHIRWGDQATTQMGSVPLSGYIEAVRWLQRRARSRGQAPPTSVLLTSEDANAVAGFRAAAPTHWRVYAHDYRRHAALADLSKPSARLARLGPTSLFQLFLALEANSFVCTSGSNWCRLVNELRKSRLDPHPSCQNCTIFVDLCGGEW